jgi:hypothetical protein
MYADLLVNEGVMSKEEVEGTVADHSEWLNGILKSMDTYVLQVTNKQRSQWNLLVKGIYSNSVTCILLVNKWAKLANSKGQSLERLVAIQLLKKFPALYGTQTCITLFTTGHCRSLFRAILTVAEYINCILLRHILILSSHWHIFFQVVPPFHVFQTKFFMYVSLFQRVLHVLSI